MGSSAELQTSHHVKAVASLIVADETPELEDSTRLAALSTAHAVLALIDIITGDRETEIENLQTQIDNLKKLLELKTRHIDELEDQLEGAYDTLRRHEQAATADMEANNQQLRKSHE